MQRVVSVVEAILMTACIAGMVLMVLAQIVMRNIFNSGFPLGDPIVKHLVLWITFIGAAIASKKGAHIRLDIADRLIRGRAQQVKEAVVGLFSAGVCTVLARASYVFVAADYTEKTGFGTTDFPMWAIEVIMPIGFVVISLRFAVAAISSLIKAVKPA